jgi:aminopeptidase N
MPDAQPKAVYLRDYRPPDYSVDTVELDFELDEQSTTVRCRMSIVPHAAAPAEAPLVLDGHDMELESIVFQGRSLNRREYRLDNSHLTLPAELLADSSPPYRLEVETRISPSRNTSLEGLYLSRGNFCTQCEAEGFRRITYFPDRPDVMARYRTRIVADRARYPVLLSNGNLVEQRQLADNRHCATWEDPFRKPSYLFALVAGDLAHLTDTFTTASAREVALHVYVEQRNADRCDHAMQSLKRAMRWDEQMYNREYDLDTYMVVAVDDFNMGAMENKGLNIFNSKYVLARPDTATDYDFEAIEAVVAHEYFHNWTGNRITCRDWFQLSLKEGLTVFREQQFAADMGSAAVKRIDAVRFLRNHQFPEDAGPMAHPVRPPSYIEMNNFYTTTVYNKGAEIIRMYHTLLGAEGFRRGMDLYFARHDGQAVTTDDFAQAMAEANDADLTQFRRWYDQAGTPVVNASARYDEANHSYELQLEQSCPAASGQAHETPLHIPLALGLLDPDGNEIPLQLHGESKPGGATRVLDLRQRHQCFRFENVPTRPVPSLLRAFSAPIKMEYAYRDNELAFLMATDPDPFNRWNASQQLALRTLLRMVRTWRADGSMTVDPVFVEAVSNTLRRPSADPALDAETLTLPNEVYVGESMGVIDVTGVHTAHVELSRSLAQALRAPLLKAYERCATKASYRFAADQVAARRLKNRCLAYLMELANEQSRALCMEQFRCSDNMTDTLAALAVLTQHDCHEREEALSSFYSRWADDPLVLDKWFTLQATSRLPGTLDVVRGLMEHPRFSITNPNRVRALVGAFCTGNSTGFHVADGAGYRFLGSQVARLNGINPQVAARLVTPLTRWRRYDPSRQALMRDELERLRVIPDISRDVFEIVARSLE